MEKSLRVAFESKERAELFLNNLGQLRSNKSINEASFNALKTEYSVSLQHAQIKIEQAKQQITKHIALKTHQLSVFKQELANLDARFKVGQIPSEIYLRAVRNPQKKASALEEQIAHLTAMLNAKSSAEIPAPRPAGLMALFASGLKRRSSADILVGQHTWVAPEQTIQQTPDVEQAPVNDNTSIIALHVLPDRAYPGSSIGIIATVFNSGQEAVKHRAEFKVEGRLESINEVTIEPGGNQDVTFMTVGGPPGDYYISVDGASSILRIIPPA
jgi:hypothetical protein